MMSKIEKLVKISSTALHNLALDAGIAPGHTDYVRFLILGKGRTGSNFLRGLLASHPQVRTFGEIFRRPGAIGWDTPGYFQTPRLLDLIQRDPGRFVEEKVFRRFPPSVRAVGFKLFYHHAQDENWRPVWAYLQQRREIRILHLRRWNMLKALLSLKRALRTDRWTNTGGEPEEEPPLTLDYQECLDTFTRTQERERALAAFFADHPLLDIRYEDLARDYRGEMQRVLAFLDLEDYAVQPMTHKQSHRPLSEAIANYAELKRRFAGTPWEDFFEV